MRLKLSRAHVQQLRGVIPFVQGFALLQAVVTLQAQHVTLQSQAQGFGQFGFADPGLALQQQRALQLERQKNRSSQAAIRKIPDRLQGPDQ